MRRSATSLCVWVAGVPLLGVSETRAAEPSATAVAPQAPAAGNPSAECAIPAAAQPADVTSPDHVVGDGSPASCTGDAFIAAVALGGTIRGNSANEPEYTGGGAIWARGGQLKVTGSRFFNNSCDAAGPDVGGAAIRAFSQYENRPVYVAGSTFGGAPGLGNACSNGGGISSINVSWSVYNSVFSHNHALGYGGNPAEAGTPGGGSGGAIYSDGMSNTLQVCGTRIENNQVNAYGSGIFFVNNDHGGRLQLDSTVVRNNGGGGWNVLPGVSMHEDTAYELIDSTLE